MFIRTGNTLKCSSFFRMLVIASHNEWLNKQLFRKGLKNIANLLLTIQTLTTFKQPAIIVV